MKQFLLASILRSRLPLAALALGFALWASPARAITINSGDITIGAGDTQYVSFSCTDDEVATATGGSKNQRVTLTATPGGHVKLYRVMDDGSLTETTSINMFISNAAGVFPLYGSEFVVRGVAPGTATVTASIGGNSASIGVTVTEPTNITFRDNYDNPGTVFYFPESTTQARLKLDFGYKLPQDVEFTITPAPNANINFTSPLTAYQGGEWAYFDFNPLNGPASAVLTFTGDAAYQNGASVMINITNRPPQLTSPAGTEENPLQLEDVVLRGAEWTFTARAKDVPADTVTFHWFVNGVEVETTTGVNSPAGSESFTSSARLPIDNEEMIVSVYADDGTDSSEYGYWAVKTTAASKIIFTDVCTLQAIVTGGGNGPADFVINPETTRKDDADKEWSPVTERTGNDFKASKNTVVQPILPEDTPAYPFGWMFPDPMLASAPSDLYIPNPSVEPIGINTPSEGVIATIRYFSSNPYKNYWNEITGERIDAGWWSADVGRWVGGFGDFDQDGLSDEWEAWYLDGGKDNNTHSFDEWQNLAVTVGKGQFGSFGTMWRGGTFYSPKDDNNGVAEESMTTVDVDRIPTARYEEIDNVWTDDPHFFADGDNKVRAFVYPLTGNYIDYGTYVGADIEFPLASVTGRAYDVFASKRDGASKPYFSNIMEFRGLPQTSSDISADMENAPNWVMFGYPGILSRTNLAVRGNCPGTDPTVADTDGDAMDDGWEYYFWTTILYENKPEYWRAYDPTFTLYPNLAPGGSADFRSSGIPLLHRDLEGYEAEWNGGLFVRYAPQSFEPELIRDECYYGSPNLDPTTRTNDKNSLTNTPIAAVAYFEDEFAEEPTPAVVFMMGGLEVYTRDGHVDALGRAKLFFDPRQFADYYDAYGNPHISYAGQEGTYPSAIGADAEPGEIPGAYVDFATGQFFLPGYDAFPSYIQEVIGSRDAVLTASYRTLNGLFPKAWLLNQFDPNGNLSPNINDPNFGEILGALGLSPQMWNPANDLDGDGISDADEFYIGTNPLHWDTDGDGLPDGWEVLFDLDPHDPTDASKNPDCDQMYARGPYRHCDALLYDYFQQFYWNGAVSLGFLPGAGAHTAPVANPNINFTSREEFYVQKWMIGKDDSGNFPMFTQLVYPSQWVDANGNMIKSLNPRSDDSNADHIPDGWALYAGYKPAGSIDLIDYVFAAFFPPYMFCPDSLRPDPDDKAGDGLGWRQEFENWTMYKTRQAQEGNTYLEEEQCVGHYHSADWYKPTAEEWTNKLFPTDPWHGDTDGDCVPDAAEYREDGADNNGDGVTLVNLNPCSADTRFDRLGDCWHYMTGTYDTTNSLGGDKLGVFGPYGDPDMDGLPNYQEYLSAAVYGWRYDYWYSPDHEELWVPFGNYQGFYSMSDDYLPGRIAADPYIAANYSVDPIPGANLRLYEVCDFFDPPVPMSTDAYPYGKSVHFQPYRQSDFFRARPSDVRINDIVSTVVRLENRWKRHLTHVFKMDGSVLDAEGWDESNSPTLNDLARAEEDPQFKVSVIANYMQRVFAITHDVEGRFVLDQDPETGAELPTAFISIEEFYTLYDGTPCAENDLRDYMYSYGRAPAPWEPVDVQVVDPGPPVLWRFMTPKANGFPSCMPRDPDTDNDGMDDYWEVYHALNPLYGGSPSVGGAGSYPDQDRADVHPWGNGSTRDWIIEANPAYVRILDPTDAGLQPVPREDAPFHTPLGFPVAAAAHFDYKSRPWLSGDRFADPDQDGLSNQEECYNYLLNDVLHHTDPSPYWFTDPSYAESLVNLYYQLDGEMASTYWWWDLDLLETDADGPTYLFDFELGEGFDTDNDNISDRVELTQDDNNGVTDPLDLDSPRKRKALYFDGYAAARTRNPYYHDKFTLTSYTVEFWVRPQELPPEGRRATLVQRPVLMPVDDSSGATHWQIRNTFLIQIDHLGQIHAQVDNDAIETVSSATAVSSGRLVADHWAHVAVVMDSQEDRLAIYINGEHAGSVGAGLKPCTGGLFGFQWLSPTGTQDMWENANLYDYSPAPIVLGAYDRNPWGIVSGAYETFPWGTAISRTIAGQSEPDFDPDQFFVGWMDEVRIWDRCRTQAQILNNMSRRFTKADIEAINQKRFRWEVTGWEPDRVGVNLIAATADMDFPQKLLYHYSFDNLPDVMAARDRDTSFMEYFTADADPFPAGWQSATVSAYRPNPFWTAPMWYHYRSLVFPHLVPWWYTATHRSNVYTDYSYIPWIENTVAHLPQTPALDMKGLHPNWNTDVAEDGLERWELTSYRYRSPLDWLNDAMIAKDFVPYRQDDVVPAALPASGSADVKLSLVKNTMNPYVMFYRTAVSIADQVAPNAFAGKLDTYGRYTGIPVLSDMLPLLDAVADIDVELWDGKGRGTELSAIDTDGDGMPDWWEIAQGLDPNSAAGANGAYGDPDHDGLDNYAEYLARTNPYRYDTDSDGYSDYYSRPNNRELTYGELYDDSDGMDNAWEIEHHLDPNRYDATDDYDDDGWTNWEEYMAGTRPDIADEFPEPTFNVMFYYNGENVYTAENDILKAGTPLVQAYGEKTVGAEMGGHFDGRYQSNRSEYLDGITEDAEDRYKKAYPNGITIAGANSSGFGSGWDAGSQWGLWQLDAYPVADGAQIMLYVQGQPTLCEVSAYDLDPNFGLIVEVQATANGSGLGGYGIGLLRYSTGEIFTKGTVRSVRVAKYAVAGRAFPYTSLGMHRMATGVHDHMVSGWNRFLGWLDLNGDETWNPGLEPMGLSLPRPSLVSWDTVETTIPLTDSLWDFPRLGWADALEAVSNMVPTEYIVTFSYIADITKDPDSETVVTNPTGRVAYDDNDGDGLDSYQEALAGTDPAERDTAGDGRMDYDSQSAAGTLTWGELYDDGDRLPSRWEADNGTDPDRYDAEDDPDGDGWTNYEEYLAGTRPTDAGSYPVPNLSFSFLYAGNYAAATNGSANPAVAAYSERRKGTYLDGNSAQGIYMGGTPDGVYALGDGYIENGRQFGETTRTVSGTTYAATKLLYGNIRTARITIVGSENALEAAELNPEMLLAAADPDGSSVLVEKEAGYVLSTGSYIGKTFKIEYEVDGYTYPLTASGFIRTKGTHAVGGYNRFFGWLDGNGNGTWDDGEPAGLSLYNASYVSQSSATATFPLTDELFGFPRISWGDAVADISGDMSSTNGNVTAYKVYIWNSAGAIVVPDGGIVIEAPRTFIHEGDYIEAGIRGIDLGSSAADTYDWSVVADNGAGEILVKEGTFLQSVRPNVGSRRTMKAVSPVAGSTVNGTLVEFKWEMDWRTEGVEFEIKNSGGTVVLSKYIPFPVRHNKITDDDYYYTYVPQLEDGRSIVNLPSGTYTYTIKESIRSTAVDKQSVTGTFKIVNAGDSSRVLAAIKGHVHYYGRLGANEIPGKVVVQAYPVAGGAKTSLGISGNPVARATVDKNTGEFALYGLSAGKYAVIGWYDSDNDGKFTDEDTQGFGFLGGSASPIQVAGWYPALAITNNPDRVAIDLEDVHVVLRDRDTDGDGKPESYTGSAAQWKAATLRTFPNFTQAQIEALGWFTSYLFSTNNLAGSSTSSETQEGQQNLIRNWFKAVVKAPRTFFHEEDLLRCRQYNELQDENGHPTGVLEPTDSYVGYGFNLGVTNSILMSWMVEASDGFSTQPLMADSFRIYAGTEGDRRAMKARYPTQLTKVHGNTVEFEWEMDWRNAGVQFDLWRIGDIDEGEPRFWTERAPEPVVTNLTIAFPICRGRTDTDHYYYTAQPQLAIGKQFLPLEDGVYEYRITERPQVLQQVFPKKSITERFQLDNSGELRGLYDAEGNIRYYGKLMERTVVEPRGTTTQAGKLDYELTVSTNDIVPGAMCVMLVRAKQGDETSGNWYDTAGAATWAEEFFNDSAANGILYASSTTNSSAWSGTIDYETGRVAIQFANPGPAAGRRIVVARKTFPAPLYLQAFRLSDPGLAKTCAGVAGIPAVQKVQDTKGNFVLRNLTRGDYAIRAFVDSNGNGQADDWETQGVAELTATASPNLHGDAAPITVLDDVKGLMIVLHDRDTDNDLLPDAWEYWRNGDLATSGYDTTDSSAGNLFWWQEYADGVLDSDPRTPDTDLDGLTDAMEILVTGTDTHLWDTDGDGIGDLEEFLAGSDPLDAEVAIPYTVPAFAIDGNGVPYVDIEYPALKSGVVLTYELQRKLSLDPNEAWETVASQDVANTDGAAYYSGYDGVNDRMSAPGTVRMLPADQAEGVDFTTGFYRVKVYADYGKMVDNGDGTWSYWTWVKGENGSYVYREAARGAGTLVRDGSGNWKFVSDATGLKKTLVRDEDGNWSFQD